MSDMITLQNLAKKHTVKVNTGSGVLLNGATDAYSYVLTAKHVLMNCGENGQPNCVDCSACPSSVSCKQPECAQISIKKYPDGTSLVATEMFCSVKWDALILKVHYQSDLSLCASFDEIMHNAPVTLFGYPKNTQGNEHKFSSQIKRFECHKHDQVDDLKRIIVRNDSFADLDGVEGFSGGGFFDFDVETNSIFLVSIENRMDNAEADHGHICGVMLNAYSDLVEEHSLAKLQPLHLTDFKHSQKYIFHAEDLSNERSLDGVKFVFSEVIREHILPTKESPSTILEKFSEKLLAYRQVNQELQHARLWIWFLEFLTIQLIIKPPKSFTEGWEVSYFDEIFRLYRFIFSSKPIGYKHVYRDLLLQTPGLSSLRDESKIVLLTDGRQPPNPILDKEKLNKHNPDISKASSEDIATVRLNKNIRNNVIHWKKLNNDCLFESEDEFEDLNAIDHERDIVNLLKDKYAPYLVGEE
ncbi:MAG: hypothetical protein BA863_18465 [Desulfovibrio sp. S3730MH75]|nr:MAG: hypothetical protein BA863_18465 [Desulfovibrio sp. S3730MH75]